MATHLRLPTRFQSGSVALLTRYAEGFTNQRKLRREYLIFHGLANVLGDPDRVAGRACRRDVCRGVQEVLARVDNLGALAAEIVARAW